MRVVLPLTAPPVSPTAANSEPTPTAPRPKGTILVVDDEPMVLEVLSESLLMLGYQVLRAPGGLEGIEAFRRDPDAVDAVVLDLVMPRMGGREVYQALIAMRPEVRVLIITGYASNHVVQELMDLGVRGLLSKPFSISRLATALAAVLPAEVDPRA